MNCRAFRSRHDAYLDDTLSGVELDAMARHRNLCEPCARLDTRMRRALLVAHNLPIIQPSARFTERLQRRLAQEQLLLASVRLSRAAHEDGWWPPLSAGAYAAMAAGILAVAGLAAALTQGTAERDAIRLAPVIAYLPETDPSRLTTPAMVASMPLGMTVWPALYVAQQTSWQFASDVQR